MCNDDLRAHVLHVILGTGTYARMSGQICVLFLHMRDGILEHGHRHAVERDDAREGVQGDGLHEA